MLLPYNVDRVTRHTPWVTYSLIAANTFIFLITIMVANLSLPADREEGKREIAALVKETSPHMGMEDPQPSEQNVGLQRAQMDETGPQWANAAQIQQYQALILASKHIQTPDDFRRLYVIEHAYDSFVDEPHYSVLTAFAYHPAEPSAVNKILTLFTAMFLHSGLDHLVGNMLFLWIFGRAIEEFLGRRFFLSAYLCSGVAATFLQHIVTALFAPSSMGIPNLGASGAIAGVLGLFAVRFYRTKVRIFYLWGWGFWAFGLLFAILNAIFYAVVGERLIAAPLAFLAAGAAVFMFGRGNSWGAFRIPSVWMIGIWVVLLNIVPALWQMFSDGGGGGVAYWAHLGGFVSGALYAFLIGGIDEGKTEYALEDAKMALQSSGSEQAISHITQVLEKEADNPAAHEVAARANDRRKTFPTAAFHYAKAIEGYWKRGERDAASRLYGIALENHPQLPLRASLLLGLANHLAQNSMGNESAAILTRLTEEFPQSPEAEIALLRAAQLWLREFKNPAEALRQIETFRQMYPFSQWETQAKAVERAAREKLQHQ